MSSGAVRSPTPQRKEQRGLIRSQRESLVAHTRGRRVEPSRLHDGLARPGFHVAPPLGRAPTVVCHGQLTEPNIAVDMRSRRGLQSAGPYCCAPPHPLFTLATWDSASRQGYDDSWSHTSRHSMGDARHSSADWRTDMRVSSSSRTSGRGKLLRRVTLGAVVSSLLLPGATMAAPTPAVAPPSKSLTAQWWQTYVSVSAADAATRCDLGVGGVVFLGATATGSVSGSCTLAAGTSVLLPLINVECSSLEVGTDFFGRNPGQRLICAKRFADEFTDLALTINGVAVGNLRRLRVRSQPFEFSPVSGNVLGVPVGTGGSVSDGYWALIGPLAPGDYEVVASGSAPTPTGPFTTNITYRLHVV
jgi:hypothetical protein